MTKRKKKVQSAKLSKMILRGMLNKIFSEVFKDILNEEVKQNGKEKEESAVNEIG